MSCRGGGRRPLNTRLRNTRSGLSEIGPHLHRLCPGVAMVMAVEDSMLRVVVRLRPPTPKELESQRRPVVQVVDERVLVFDPEEPDGGFLGLKWGSAQDGPRKKGKDLTFVFDRVFGEMATQQDVFQHTTHSILDSFLQGYNCSGEPACPSAGHQMRKALALPSLWAPHSVFSGVGATLLGPGIQ